MNDRKILEKIANNLWKTGGDYNTCMMKAEDILESLKTMIEETYDQYSDLQDRYRKLTGKNHEWLK